MADMKPLQILDRAIRELSTLRVTVSAGSWTGELEIDTGDLAEDLRAVRASMVSTHERAARKTKKG